MSFTASRIPVASLAWLLGGCVDVGARFDEFLDRNVDAAAAEDIDAEPIEVVGDINGRFYLGLAPSVAPTLPLQFIVTNEMIPHPDGTATASFELVALSSDRLPVADPIVLEGVTVDLAGLFVAEFVDVELPGTANPISGSPLVAPSIELSGTVRTDDLYCGSVDGMITLPAQISLSGSTFSAIRVPEGVIGDDLPPVQTECPEDPAK
jgi:hypothetical protein